MLVLLRLAQLSIVDPSAVSAGHVLPWEKPKLVVSDLSDEVCDLTGEAEEETEESIGEESGLGAAEDVEPLAVDVEAFCAGMEALGPDAFSRRSTGHPKVKTEEE